MHFANDDDDVDFTVQPGSSKLANLFSDNDAAKAGNSSLTYTPPRQPSVGKTADKQSSSGTLSLLHVAVVQAFKYEGKQPSNQGKLGIAVLGNHDTSNYKLILYKEKQQQLAVAAINAQFAIKVQGNNFLSFVDEKRFNWSVKFDSEEALINFAKQAVIAKAESHGTALVNLDNIISQDLILGEAESEALKIGSTAVIKYTAWVLREHRLKKVLDTTDIDEPQKLKLGRGKQVKGLEEGLVGCRKNSRRFLVLPPSHGYGSKGLGTTVPPNAVLVFDVSVGSIVKSKSATKDSTPRSSTPVSLPAEEAERKESRSHSHGSVDEPARSRAPSAPPDWPPQQLATNPAVAPATAVVSGGESDKARLLSRIARMGAQMLPMPGAVPAQPSSDSEGEDDRSRVPHQVPAAVPLPQPTAREGSPKPVVKPRTFSQHSLGDAVSHPTPVPPTLQPMVNSYASGPAAPTMPATPHMALYQAQSQLAQSALAAYPYQQQGLLLPPGAHTYSAAVPSAASVAADMQLPFLLSETRSQNTEVRLNISKLADKVDEILRKLDAAKSQLPSAPLLGSHMDSDVLLCNIQRMVQDNEKLKSDNCEKDQKIQGLTEKICDLLQKNQRLMEESNSMFEQRSDAMHSSAAHSQARLLALETEKMEVTERLTQALSELSLLRAELSERQQKESQELEGLRSASEGKEGTLKSLEDRLMKEAEQQRKQFEEAIETYEKKLAACNEMHVTKDSAAENLKQSLASCNKECSELQTQIHQLKSKHKEEIDSLESRISQLIGEAESTRLEERVSGASQEAMDTTSQTAPPLPKECSLVFLSIVEGLFKALVEFCSKGMVCCCQRLSIFPCHQRVPMRCRELFGVTQQGWSIFSDCALCSTHGKGDLRFRSSNGKQCLMQTVTLVVFTLERGSAQGICSSRMESVTSKGPIGAVKNELLHASPFFIFRDSEERELGLTFQSTYAIHYTTSLHWTYSLILVHSTPGQEVGNDKGRVAGGIVMVELDHVFDVSPHTCDPACQSLEHLQCQELEKQKQLQQENQASGAASTSATGSFNFEAELKKIMNVLFKLLQREFSSQETYSRKEAMQIILATIREYTTEVLQRRQAPSTSNNGTSRSSPASTTSSSTGSPSASGPTSATTSALTSAPTSEAAAPQLSKNLVETGEQEGKNNGSLDTPSATEEPLSEATTGPAGNVVSGHHSKRPEHAPEDSHSEVSVDTIAETAEEPGQHKVPVTQAGDEKETGDSTKEGASGDARLSSSAEGKTGPEPPARSESVQPQDWESFLTSLQQASRVYGENIPPVWMTLLSLAGLIVSLLAVRYGLYY
ncbi:uncharacterized protein LOC142571031 [Dermacentor variabilis]|uniref:uncharacterized protein LOC142571031 n=1 Tax=Dermacentor variabilis TaxID=34621 RepID=UPI003F5B1CD0